MLSSLDSPSEVSWFAYSCSYGEIMVLYVEYIHRVIFNKWKAAAVGTYQTEDAIYLSVKTRSCTVLLLAYHKFRTLTISPITIYWAEIVQGAIRCSLYPAMLPRRGQICAYTIENCTLVMRRAGQKHNGVCIAVWLDRKIDRILTLIFCSILTFKRGREERTKPEQGRSLGLAWSLPQNNLHTCTEGTSNSLAIHERCWVISS